MSTLTVTRLAILPATANYAFFVHDAVTGLTAVVDPGDAEPILEECQRRHWRLSHIWVTHHHHDHVDGIAALRAATGAALVAADEDQRRIPSFAPATDLAVRDGQSFAFGSHTVRVLGVSGHTIGHVAYHLPSAPAVFCGDTLFSLGCGRMFEGTPGQFWSALEKLRDLPDETLMYCAHEYTASNLRFALAVDPDNEALKQRALVIAALSYQSLPTIPCLLGDEKATNPFLRADDPALMAALGLKGQSPAAVFAHLRARKDSFA